VAVLQTGHYAVQNGAHHEAVAACCPIEGKVGVLRPHVHNVEVVLVAIQLLKASLDSLRAGAVPAARVAHQHQHTLSAAARCAAAPRPVEWPQLRSTRRAAPAMLQDTMASMWPVSLIGAAGSLLNYCFSDAWNQCGSTHESCGLAVPLLHGCQIGVTGQDGGIALSRLSSYEELSDQKASSSATRQRCLSEPWQLADEACARGRRPPFAAGRI
jgi:hypothetical protein